MCSDSIDPNKGVYPSKLPTKRNSQKLDKQKLTGKKYLGEGCISGEKQYKRACGEVFLQYLLFMGVTVTSNDDGSVILSTSFFLKCYYFQYTNFLSVSDMKLVIMNDVIPVYASGKKGKIEPAPVLTRIPLLTGQ